MDPNTGDVFRIRQELIDGEPGDRIDMQAYRDRLAEIVRSAEAVAASDDELRASRAERLVTVSEQAAQKLILGERERERRRRRRQATKRMRKRNRN